MRQRISLAGLALLVAACLVSLLQQATLGEFYKNWGRSDNFIAVQVGRVHCLEDALPPEGEALGFLPALPRRMEDPKITNSIIRLRSDQYRTLYLTQFALAPRLIAYYDRGDWIIANYPDHEQGLAAVAETLYTIVKDCGSGVFLLKRGQP